jgi:hypothetical protein
VQITVTQRGFVWLEHPPYTSYANDKRPVLQRLAAESSAIGNYDDALQKPGSSFLWIGEYHHLDREEVAEFVKHLQTWLATGRLNSNVPPGPTSQ